MTQVLQKPSSKKNENPSSEKEFIQEIIDLSRVTRVMAGGKRMRFRACVAVGDKHGRVGIGIAKGADVTQSINKAVSKAKKNLVRVPIVHESIPYEVTQKFGAARVFLKPAPKGTGVRAGGSVRTVLVLAGIPNIVGKIMGSKNKINNVSVTIRALKQLSLIGEKPVPKKKTDSHSSQS